MVVFNAEAYHLNACMLQRGGNTNFLCILLLSLSSASALVPVICLLTIPAIFPSLILFSLSFYWKPRWDSVSVLASSFAHPHSSAESTQEVPMVFMSLVAQHAPWPLLFCPNVKDACLCVGYCCKHEGSIGEWLTEHITPLGMS